MDTKDEMEAQVHYELRKAIMHIQEARRVNTDTRNDAVFRDLESMAIDVSMLFVKLPGRRI